jgi:uncharacterized membrane protein YqjE
MEWLFDANSFNTRDTCGHWTQELVTVYIVANAVIALAYYTIPVFLLVFHKRRKDLLVSPLATMMFVGFITLCGSTHVCNVLVFFWPAYRFFALLDVMTAISSIGTAIIMPFIAQQVMNLPTAEQHEEMVELLISEIQSATEARESAVASSKLLEIKVEQLTRLLEHKAWNMATKQNLADLKEQLTRVKNTNG